MPPHPEVQREVSRKMRQQKLSGVGQIFGHCCPRALRVGKSLMSNPESAPWSTLAGSATAAERRRHSSDDEPLGQAVRRPPKALQRTIGSHVARLVRQANHRLTCLTPSRRALLDHGLVGSHQFPLGDVRPSALRSKMLLRPPAWLVPRIRFEEACPTIRPGVSSELKSHTEKHARDSWTKGLVTSAAPRV